MTIEVDLLDQDGVIVSIAAVDETFWAANSAAATATAASKGFSVDVPSDSPNLSKAELNISNLGGWGSWLSTQDDQASQTATANTGTTAMWVLGGSVLAAWWLLS